MKYAVRNANRMTEKAVRFLVVYTDLAAMLKKISCSRSNIMKKHVNLIPPELGHAPNSVQFTILEEDLIPKESELRRIR